MKIITALFLPLFIMAMSAISCIAQPDILNQKSSIRIDIKELIVSDQKPPVKIHINKLKVLDQKTDNVSEAHPVRTDTSRSTNISRPVKLPDIPRIKPADISRTGSSDERSRGIKPAKISRTVRSEDSSPVIKPAKISRTVRSEDSSPVIKPAKISRTVSSEESPRGIKTANISRTAGFKESKSADISRTARLTDISDSDASRPISVTYCEATFKLVPGSDEELRDVSVNLDMIYSFSGETIPGGIENVGRRPIRNISVMDINRKPLPFKLSKQKEYEIKWDFPNTDREQRVTVHFIIVDAVEGTFDENFLKLEWTKDWEIPVYNVTYRFILPDAVKNIRGKPAGHKMVRYLSHRAMEIHRKHLSSDPFSVHFSPKLVKEKLSGLDWFYARVISPFLRIAGILLFLILTVGFLVLWFFLIVMYVRSRSGGSEKNDEADGGVHGDDAGDGNDDAGDGDGNNNGQTAGDDSSDGDSTNGGNVGDSNDNRDSKSGRYGDNGGRGNGGHRGNGNGGDNGSGKTNVIPLKTAHKDH